MKAVQLVYFEDRYTIAGAADKLGFDDAFIYEELDLKPAERRLPSEVLLPEEAIRAFHPFR